MRRALALAAAALVCVACASAPAPAAPRGPAAGTARLGQTVDVGEFRVTPTALVEDSRCPADAMCVQQGTLRVRATVAGPGGRSEHVFDLSRPLLARDRWLALAAGCPYPLASQPKPPTAYRFVFTVDDTDVTPAPDGYDCD
ncbi:MAG TPA: hypothetical protein VF699_02710 [Caulobacteraceae bacterium]|jgi:hypothetical protein